MDSKTKIKHLLQVFQTAYRARAVEEADAALDSTFAKQGFASIIGTGDGELFLTRQSIRDLFISDWQYWGELVLDIENAIIREHGKAAWCQVPATVKYSFSDGEATYFRFVSFIEEFFDGKSYDSRKSTGVKLTEINWLLAHFLHPREPQENREYLWKLRIYFVLEYLDESWIIRHIQFSFPRDLPFADARFHPDTYFEKSYQRELEQYRGISGIQSGFGHSEMYFLQDFCRLISGKAGQKEDIPRFFSEEAILLSTDSAISRGAQDIATKIDSLRDHWDEIELNLRDSARQRVGDSFLFHASGLFKKQIADEDLLEATAAKVQSVLRAEISPKDKLFVIRRDISNSLKELMYGQEYIHPFRFDAFIVKQDDHLCFDYLQFSFAQENILEQINNDFLDPG